MALSKYRPVWHPETLKYAPWVKGLAKQNGVYVVRHPAAGDDMPAETLYVGESHTNQLRETLQRHFQIWNGDTAGPTFDRHLVEVAVELCASGEEAVARQNELILALQPVLNRELPLPDMRRGGRGRVDVNEEADAVIAGDDDDESANLDELAAFFDDAAADF